LDLIPKSLCGLPSRNIGIAHCTKEIVAMTDDDARVFPDWIQNMKQAHRDRADVGAVGGSVVGAENEKILSKAAELFSYPNWDEPRYVHSLPGVNISYKKIVLDQIGLQDEELFRGEDVDFNWRIIESGYKILYDPRVKVYHYHRPTLGGFLNQYYMYGRAHYLLRRKWWDKRRTYPQELSSGNLLYITFRFVSAMFTKPFSISRRLDSKTDRVRIFPYIFAADFMRRVGIVVQAIIELNPF
jgi:GT2 family glycosyltransferase